MILTQNEGQKLSQVVRSQTRFWVVSTVCHMYMTVQSAVPDITFLNGSPLLFEMPERMLVACFTQVRYRRPAQAIP